MPTQIMPENDMRQLIAALHYAALQHRNQRRKDVDQSPYINHPISLLHILAVEAGVQDVEVLCAATLHDVIEDCAETPAEREQRAREIETLFGAQVRRIVEEVTDDKDQSQAERKQQQIDHGPQLSEQAKLVKLADKITNLRDVAHQPPQGWSDERRREYFEWARAVIDAMGATHAKLHALFEQAYAGKP